MIDTTTYLADAKNVYGAVQEQVNTLAAFMNLLGDGSKFGKINSLGIRGYTFLARLAPNWNMGYRLEGYTGVGNGLANAGNIGMANSTVLLKYAYVPTIITGQAEILTKGDGRAFMQAKAMEAKFDMKDIMAHVNIVMVAAERGGNLAKISVVTDATHYTLSTVGNLPGALYIRVGMPVNIGAIGGGAQLTCTVTAVNYAANTIVTDNGGAAPNVGDCLTLAGEAALGAGTFPVTSEGLMSIVTATGALQGLDPATSGQAPWQAYVQDMAAATISPAAFTALSQFVKMRSGEDPDIYLFPEAQINQLVSIATTTLQFQTQPGAGGGGVAKRALDLGYTTYSFGGKAIVVDKDARYDRVFAGDSNSMKKFEALPLSMADDEAGSWTRISGTNGIADAVQGLLRWYHNLGTVQRNAWGMQKNYAVPATFANVPPSL